MMPFQRPTRSLPIGTSFSDEEEYVDSLLEFATSSKIFQKLCGGVHILDFLTQEPSLYSSILPEDWIRWLRAHDVYDFLQLLLHENIESLHALCRNACHETTSATFLRMHRHIPRSLLEYIVFIRKHALCRDLLPIENSSEVRITRKLLTKEVAVGMKAKKAHEVGHFAEYVNEVANHMDHADPNQVTGVVDFGSGQNYLGRTLASAPYEKHVIALESKQLNIDGAKNYDVAAKISEKEKQMRNKKFFRAKEKPAEGTVSAEECCKSLPNVESDTLSMHVDYRLQSSSGKRITYIQTMIEDGDLNGILPRNTTAQHLVVSLHSCGNLLHHGLRSLVLNPSVKAVAMIGCCYNLMTERLGPPTYKIPSLRIPNQRLEKTSQAFDPHGFPMSERLTKYKHSKGQGIRLNITARMMAVQAPQNWTNSDCEGFFTRHFYRALLQRIFLDRGLIPNPYQNGSCTATSEIASENSAGPAEGTPITIGSLRKSCYTSFHAYVRGAMEKLARDPEKTYAGMVNDMRKLTDDEIREYEERYKESKKDLSVIWSLMAFSATVVESIIVVDRWLYLKEQPEVADCWVEPVFEYKQSPRNLVVVGIKR